MRNLVASAFRRKGCSCWTFRSTRRRSSNSFALCSDLRPPTLITVPFGDIGTMDRFKSLGLERELLEQSGDSDLVALRRYLFARSQPPAREPAGDVRFFSAPGEGRECVEIARRIVEEARNGVPFDEIAVFVRAPQRYLGLLEH